MSRDRYYYRRGYDPRRHQLTIAERARGGRTRWWLTMLQLRATMGLPLPRPPAHLTAARVARYLARYARPETDHPF